MSEEELEMFVTTFLDNRHMDESNEKVKTDKGE